jgi:hypothetical protein
VREGEREKKQGGKKTEKKIISRFRVLNPKQKIKTKNTGYFVSRYFFTICKFFT